MHTQTQTLRVILNIALFVSVLFLPWWLSIVFMVILLVFYTAYEIVFWGLAIDMLYSAPVPLFANFVLIFTVFSLLLFVSAEILKRRLIFYS